MSTGSMERVLRIMAEKKASDVFISANTPVMIKIQGQMLPLSDAPLSPMQPRQLISEVATQAQMDDLDRTGELNVGVGISGVGSFRMSAFHQRGTVAAVFRCIPAEVPHLDSLNLPPILGDLILQKRGLVLMVGATGTGKSTTLAAMIEKRNQEMVSHILTIEDPIEFLFKNKRSVVNQREVGRDTQALQAALRNALRQAPDVVMIGEIRDRETMTAAMSYALSGHLVLATLHANNSYHALGRILSFYPPESRSALMSDLSSGLKAIVSQRLLRGTGGQRVPAVEILLNTKLVSDLILQGDFNGIKEAMERSMAEGCQTFEQEIAQLIRDGKITREEGVAHADSPTNLLWRLQNDEVQVSKAATQAKVEEPTEPSFTEFTLDVVSEDPRRTGSPPRRGS